MFAPGSGVSPVKTTPARVITPFYIYAALSFLAATLLLFFSSASFTKHYFHPDILTITHVMALGWGTMMVMGAGHQLVPVLIEGKLHSTTLAMGSFFTAAVGIPLLALGFYHFTFGWMAQAGGWLVLISILCFLVNIAISMSKGTRDNVHAVFVMTGIFWLFLTAIVGLLLVYNFNISLLSMSSLHYLPLHAHMGIVGWFLLVIMGVGSRLIPMFMISKYDNTKTLWWIYGLINGGLLLFFTSFLFLPSIYTDLISLAAVLAAIILFISFCRKAYKARIRKKLEPQIKISLASGWMMLIPILIIAIILAIVWSATPVKLVMVYGFVIFFGWITAMILGMAFKTLPFILWNKKFHAKAGTGKTPNPRELFSKPIFVWMTGFYGAGFILFIAGILISYVLLLKFGAALLILTAILYNINIFRMLSFKTT